MTDTGEPYEVGKRFVIEILSLIEKRPLTEEEFYEYLKIQKRINAARERIDAMSDEEVLRL